MSAYNQLIKKYGQACPTYSQLEWLDRPSSPPPLPPSSSLPSPPSHPLPPSNYTPTGYEYNFTNFGLAHYVGNYQYYTLMNCVTWLPELPTTLILAMNNFHVLKVGLNPPEVSIINSIIYEMHRAMPSCHHSIDIEYLTHNSIIFMKLDDQTNVQLIRGDAICMTPTSILTRWPTSVLKATTLQVNIFGLLWPSGANFPCQVDDDR